jgi:hypothetical protein
MTGGAATATAATTREWEGLEAVVLPPLVAATIVLGSAGLVVATLLATHGGRVARMMALGLFVPTLLAAAVASADVAGRRLDERRCGDCGPAARDLAFPAVLVVASAGVVLAVGPRSGVVATMASSPRGAPPL